MAVSDIWVVKFNDTHMIPVCSENQNNMENMRNKQYKIVGNTPKRLTNKLIIGEFE